MKTLRAWECLDSATGENLTEAVGKYHLPDFFNWKNHDAFETTFARCDGQDRFADTEVIR